MTGANLCVVCDRDRLSDPHRCTNRCCGQCHGLYCTPGGVTGPGHNLNLTRARRQEAARQRVDGYEKLLK